MKVKILSWKEIKSKTVKINKELREFTHSGTLFNKRTMKTLCGKVIDVEVVAGGYLYGTSSSILSITDWMCDLSYKEVAYPRFFRGNHSGIVWKYTSECVSECIAIGTQNNYKLGSISEAYSIKYRIKGDNWTELPYDKERDLFHTQAVLCWDDYDDHREILGFYNAAGGCTFDYKGNLSGAEWDNYKAFPEEYLSDRMKELRSKLEV